MSAKIPPPNYTQVPNILLDHMNKLSDAELRVMMFFCRQTFGWQRKDFKASTSFIAQAVGMSSPGVFNGVKRMIEKGLLGREPDGISFKYWLIVGASEPINAVDRSEPTPINAVYSDLPTPFIGKLSKPINGVYTNKEKELKKGKKGADALPAIPESLRTPHFEKAWRDWIDERKKHITFRAAELQFKKLAAWGSDKAVKSIENSIENNWRGLFEPREDTNGRQGHAPKTSTGFGQTCL